MPPPIPSVPAAQPPARHTADAVASWRQLQPGRVRACHVGAEALSAGCAARLPLSVLGLLMGHLVRRMGCSSSRSRVQRDAPLHACRNQRVGYTCTEAVTKCGSEAKQLGAVSKQLRGHQTELLAE